jgi:uncharacterized RDD family membrane protein YckC
MEFLPTKVNGRKVYAGFRKRFFAGFVDMLVFVPVMFLFHFIDGISIEAAMIGAVLSGLMYSGYSIGFHYKFGATVGKMAAGIKVTKPNGDGIGLQHAVLRSAFDLVFAVATIYIQLVALSQVDPAIYLNAGLLEQGQHMIQFYPAWHDMLNLVTFVWVLSEFVVLLFNERKRALHDFIAGTVVVQQTMLALAKSPNDDALVAAS